MAGSRQQHGPGRAVTRAASTAGTSAQTLTGRYCRLLQLFAFALALLAAFSCARAADGMSWLQPLTDSEVDHRSFYSSLLTRHYDPEPDHNNDQNLLGYETHFQNRYLWGFAMFDNSFGQESQYAYLGRKYRAFESDRWYYKITGGMLHGYKEPYEDKIPFNEFGIAPAVIPSIGYQYKGFNAEFVQLGLSAGMITLGLSF